MRAAAFSRCASRSSGGTEASIAAVASRLASVVPSLASMKPELGGGSKPPRDCRPRMMAWM